MSGGLLWRAAAALRSRLLLPEHPLTAIEVRPGSVGLVRLARKAGRLALASAAQLELPEGTLALSLTEPNVLDPEAFKRTLAGLVDRAGAGEARAVGLVLPDPVARVALVPAAELRARSRRDALELARFRLRKAVPFEIRDAHLVQQELPAAPGREATALVAAIYLPVLASYEAPLRELGLDPGLVELAGLSLMRASGPAEDRADELLVNWDEGYCSLLLRIGGQLALVRTLVGEPASRPEEVAREVANTVLYYRERLGGQGLVRARLRSAHRPGADAIELLREALGLEPTLLDPWEALGEPSRPGLGDALAGAAACLVARAA